MKSIVLFIQRINFKHKGFIALALLSITAVVFWSIQRSEVILFSPIINQTLERPLGNEAITPSPPSSQPHALLSIRLKIPSLNINAAIESVGLTPSNSMDVPKGPTTVAWFNLGPLPGEIGSSVISGHYGRWENGPLSVFTNLSDLKPDDQIYIEDETGKAIVFVVRESRTYNPKADATDVFSSRDRKAHLNLVTCEGIWNNRTKQYSERLVIFTDKVE